VKENYLQQLRQERGLMVEVKVGDDEGEKREFVQNHQKQNQKQK